MSQNIEFRVVSSLEKVFPNEAPRVSPLLGEESIFLGETYAFQIAFRGPETEIYSAVKLQPVARSAAGKVSIRSVDLVPAALTRFEEHDHDFLQNAAPGLYPDLLSEIDNKKPLVVAGSIWRSCWVEFTPHSVKKGERCSIIVDFFNESGSLCGTAGTQVHVIAAALDPQTIIYTDWFHCDCISSYYRVKSLSSRHFSLMAAYIKTAAKNGMNMILTPIFTPPLDTEKGGERPTTQLVDIFFEDGKYSFDFSVLRHFIDICLKAGIKYFEMAHLFTQWGAQAAPKIMATVNGEYKRIFGWDTPAVGGEYEKFLGVFLPQLTKFLKDTGIAENTIFHISDEPEAQHLESYSNARKSVLPYLEGFAIHDALSDYSFFEKGVVPNPIPSNDHIRPFIEHKVPDLWTYYCCAQGNRVSNRFIAMSGARTRVIAAQLFKFDIKGFLHWGYNFWYSQNSVRQINPFAVTDSGFAFPAGDAFSVYPGEDGPLESLRLRIFASALCDLRAMQMLSRLKGREAVMQILEKDIPPIEFDNAPNNEDYVIKTRIEINNAIEKALK